MTCLELRYTIGDESLMEIVLIGFFPAALMSCGASCARDASD